MSCLTLEKKLGYIASKLDEEASFSVDVHLADCPQCASSVRALRMLRNDFDNIWDTWTAGAHSRAYRVAQPVMARLAKGLKAAARTARTPALRERIQRWSNRILEGAEAALGIVLDTPNKVARVITEGPEELRQIGSCLQFGLMPLPMRTGHPRPAEAGEELAEADPAKIAVRAEGPPWAEVRVDARAGKVSVLLELREEPWPLVLLMPKQEGQAPIVEEFRRPEGTNYLLAEFEEVPGEEYQLLMEPLS